MQVVSGNISDPPSFNLNKYEDWGRSFMFWYDMNRGFPETTLLSKIGSCCSSGPQKTILFAYCDMTKDHPESRTIGGYLEILDARFKRDANDSLVQRIQQFNSIKKHDREGMRTFWGRFERQYSFLASSQVLYSPQVLYAKALSALNLMESEVMLLTAALDKGDERLDITELRRMSIRLFDSRIQPVSDEACNYLQSYDTPHSRNGGKSDESRSKKYWDLKKHNDALERKIAALAMNSRVCRAYAKTGKCPYMGKCKFAHPKNLAQKQEDNSNTEKHLRGRSPLKKEQHPNAWKSQSPATKRQMPCFAFRNGHCPRGQNCEYSHSKQDRSDRKEKDMGKVMESAPVLHMRRRSILLISQMKSLMTRDTPLNHNRNHN